MATKRKTTTKKSVKKAPAKRTGTKTKAKPVFLVYEGKTYIPAKSTSKKK